MDEERNPRHLPRVHRRDPGAGHKIPPQRPLDEAIWDKIKPKVEALIEEKLQEGRPPSSRSHSAYGDLVPGSFGDGAVVSLYGGRSPQDLWDELWPTPES